MNLHNIKRLLERKCLSLPKNIKSQNKSVAKMCIRDREKISANASNGVLTIDLPKRTPEEKAKVNRIIEIH